MPQEPSVGRKAQHSLARKHRNTKSYGGARCPRHETDLAQHYAPTSVLAMPAHPDDEGRRPCTFFMLSANFVRNFPRKSLPFFQELRDNFTADEPLVKVALDYADVVKGTHIETTLAVSHRCRPRNESYFRSVMLLRSP